MYENNSRKITLGDYIKHNLLKVSIVSVVTVLSVMTVILVLLRKARKAEAIATRAAIHTQELNEKLQVAVEKAESANNAKSTFLFNMSHDISHCLMSCLVNNKKLQPAKVLVVAVQEIL